MPPPSSTPLQSSQGAEGPRTPPHYSKAPTNIPPFDIAKVGVLPRMSPIKDQENALLNVLQDPPVRRTAPPGLDRGQGGSGPSCLYGGRFHRISDLAATVIRDINPWLPHQARFGWGYVAMNATLWIDLWDHFAMEHHEEWTEQKVQECALNDLERDTEVVYRARIIRRQEDKLITDSKEAAAKNLPPERRAARVERQAGATPRKNDVSSTSMSATLYPDWVLSWAGKHSSPDMPQPYRTPREGASRRLTLEEELDASSVFDPLQSSQGAEGPRIPPHYSEAPTNIPPFDIAKVGMLPRMSPITDQENALLNVLQDPLLGALPLQDWTEVRVGQDQAHALTAPCRWGPRRLDRAWDWL